MPVIQIHTSIYKEECEGVFLWVKLLELVFPLCMVKLKKGL